MGSNRRGAEKGQVYAHAQFKCAKDLFLFFIFRNKEERNNIVDKYIKCVLYLKNFFKATGFNSNSFQC